jgi:hypothetical protein
MTNDAGSSLERDLRGASRDGLYRALSYLARRGAPVVSAPPEVERMQTQAVTGLRWLAERDDREDIAADYETVREHSSPMFKD